ncbi:universal stress protein [Rhodobacteraceae bacterium RKSG542]|uniref:universal stress protein n=1 Tax=Pseudovibrio flavus TaxID=2529854 RepID=UPI0012BCCAE8|nr:universal stress protein [Pseudovibrio flavus]MTI18093.1 universal stress protein [Pseudovibrio flavus]
MLKNFDRILYATDLSKQASFAFSYAVSLAEKFDAKLDIIHVVEPLSDDQRVTLTLFIQEEESRERVLQGRGEAAQHLLSQRIAEFWEAMPDDLQSLQEKMPSSRIIEGFPAEVILQESQRLNSDLIVIGAHTHGFSHTFLGSIAKRVLRRSTIPTFVVPFKDDI